MDSSDNYNYDEPPTGEYNEQAQKLWSNYTSEAERHDANITDTWKADMDSTLIFAGLFSATVTAFILESYKLLKPDSSEITTDLLGQILAVQVATASGNASFQPPDISTTPFSPSHSSVAVNILWFLSLSCSLAAALCATLIQQWTRDYLQRIHRHTQPLRRARVRAFLFAGCEKWKMDQFVESIPPLLHMSLFLFFSGLFVFLSSINKAVTGAVAAIVGCFLCFYGLATFAPLFDPSAPFETPLSSILWRLTLSLHRKLPRRFKDVGIYTTSMADLSNVRVRCAMHTPADIDGAARQDAKALQWVYERITDEQELEPFVEGIPGFLSSADGYKTWRVASRLRGSTVWAIGNRLTLLLDGCLTATPNFKRAATCLDALFALCLYYPRYGISIRDFSRQITTMSAWNNAFAAKAICISVMSGHPFLLSHSRFLDLPKDLYSLSRKADDAVRDVDDARRSIDEMLRSPNGFNKDDLALLFQQYLNTLESAGTQISRWMDIVNSHSSILDMLPLLSWYASLPRDRFSISLRNIEPFNSHRSLPIYAHQVLAYMRVTGVYPPLLDVTNVPAPDRSKAWFPFLDPTAFSHEEYKSLRQELGPLSSALSALGFKPTADQTMVDISQIRGPAVRPLQSEPESTLPLPLPFSFLCCGPFGTLALLLQDCGAGCRVTSLLDFIATLKRYSPKAVEPSVITQTLEIVYPRQIITLPEASQVLLVGALNEILSWEREASSKSPCPFSDADITRLVASLEHNLTHDFSIQFAEDTFMISKTDDDPDADPAASIPNTDPFMTQDMDRNINKRSQDVYKHVVRLRKALRNRPE